MSIFIIFPCLVYGELTSGNLKHFELSFKIQFDFGSFWNFEVFFCFILEYVFRI